MNVFLKNNDPSSGYRGFEKASKYSIPIKGTVARSLNRSQLSGFNSDVVVKKSKQVFQGRLRGYDSINQYQSFYDTADKAGGGARKSGGGTASPSQRITQ